MSRFVAFLENLSFVSGMSGLDGRRALGVGGDKGAKVGDNHQKSFVLILCSLNFDSVQVRRDSKTFNDEG